MPIRVDRMPTATQSGTGSISPERAAVILSEESDRIRGLHPFGNWNINVSFDPIRNERAGNVAQTSMFLDYQEAMINIDLSRVDSEKTFRDTFRHELLHVIFSPMDVVAKLYESVKPDELRASLLDLHSYGLEQIIEATRLMIDRAVATPTRRPHRNVRPHAPRPRSASRKRPADDTSRASKVARRSHR